MFMVVPAGCPTRTRWLSHADAVLPEQFRSSATMANLGIAKFERMSDNDTYMARYTIESNEAVSRIHPELAHVAPVQPTPPADEQQMRADVEAAMLATGWFAALEARFPDETDLHPTLCHAVEAVLADRGSVIYTNGSSLHAIIDLWSSDIDDDPALVESIKSLREGALVRAAMTLVTYHDSEDPLTATPSRAGEPLLREV